MRGEGEGGGGRGRGRGREREGEGEERKVKTKDTNRKDLVRREDDKLFAAWGCLSKYQFNSFLNCNSSRRERRRERGERGEGREREGGDTCESCPAIRGWPVMSPLQLNDLPRRTLERRRRVQSLM